MFFLGPIDVKSRSWSGKIWEELRMRRLSHRFASLEPGPPASFVGSHRSYGALVDSKTLEIANGSRVRLELHAQLS